jgi:hypothetical protein
MDNKVYGGEGWDSAGEIMPLWQTAWRKTGKRPMPL